MTPKRSALLAYWIHSSAKEDADINTIRAATQSEIRRMMSPPRLVTSLTSTRPASLGATLVAIDFMAVRARVIQLLADVSKGLVVPGLRRAMRHLADVNEV